MIRREKKIKSIPFVLNNLAPFCGKPGVFSCSSLERDSSGQKVKKMKYIEAKEKGGAFYFCRPGTVASWLWSRQAVLESLGQVLAPGAWSTQVPAWGWNFGNAATGLKSQLQDKSPF